MERTIHASHREPSKNIRHIRTEKRDVLLFKETGLLTVNVLVRDVLREQAYGNTYGWL